VSVRFKSHEEQVKLLERRVAELVVANSELAAALTDALEGMEEMLSYVPEYFVDKHALNHYIPRARAALAAGTTESEGP